MAKAETTPAVTNQKLVSSVMSLVKGFRDSARALLRLQAINQLVEDRQGIESSLARAKSKKEANAVRLADVEAGKYAPDLAGATTAKKTPEQMKEAALTEIKTSNEALDKDIERFTKNLADLDSKIEGTAKGSKGFALDKESITRTASELMRDQVSSFDLSDISGTEDNSEETAADADVSRGL